LDPVPAERIVPVGGEVDELGNQHLALLAERAGHQGDVRALSDVARHRRPVADRLVVWVGMHEQHPPRGVELVHRSDFLGVDDTVEDLGGLGQHGSVGGVCKRSTRLTGRPGRVDGARRVARILRQGRHNLSVRRPGHVP
jgi:hypothetical protein